ncbi:MAG: hypothetical protein Q7U02_01055 [Desulfosalsimonadaceae bacterium]|nr:hypothetical protein [Desulfosalsimonadaceae bacterium]
MKHWSMPQALWIGVLGLLLFGSNLAANVLEAFYGNADIWWTPKQMAMPLDETKNHFEIFISGQPLGGMIGKGVLTAVDGQGNSYRVAAGDVGVRLNNWPARQASLLKFSIIHAFISGLCAALTGLGVWQMLKQRKRNP